MHIKSEAEFLVKQGIIKNIIQFESIKGLAQLCTATARHHCIDVLVYAFPWHTNLQRIDSQVAHLSFYLYNLKQLFWIAKFTLGVLKNNERLSSNFKEIIERLDLLVVLLSM